MNIVNGSPNSGDFGDTDPNPAINPTVNAARIARMGWDQAGKEDQVVGETALHELTRRITGLPDLTYNGGPNGIPFMLQDNSYKVQFPSLASARQADPLGYILSPDALWSPMDAEMRKNIRYVRVVCFAASGLLTCLSAGAQKPEPKPVLTPAVQKHLKEIAESLPTDSPLRDGMEHGGHGGGVHRPWMDEMRQQGIKRALLRTEFVWHEKPTDIKVTRVVYFSTYEGDCGQVADPEQLSAIRSSGLEAELSNQAAQDTLRGHWMFIDQTPNDLRRSITVVTLLDDEWLPTWPISFSTSPKTVDFFRVAVDMGDVAAVKQFLREGVPAEERDGTVWAMAGVPNPCTLKALLQAGANPDMRDHYGSPLLMEEIRHHDVEDAKVLIEAGADVNAKNAYGFTILTIAEAKPGFPGQDDLVRLLKAAGARN